MMRHPLAEYFRCPEHLALVRAGGALPGDAGYFRFRNAVAYGRPAGGATSSRAGVGLHDVASAVSVSDGSVVLPFDLSEVVTNLRHEHYPEAHTAIERLSTAGLPHALYYFFRPILPVGVRKHLQRLSFGGWRRIPFPRWPVDVTVETLMKAVVRELLEKTGIRELPFIWFWPDGASGCVMMTHDIESADGSRFCVDLMNIDDSFGLRSAFQVVPEPPWASPAATARLVEQLQARGFEVNVHDLSHDGHLFRNRDLFLKRVTAINDRAREFGSRGFRSGAMYRRQDWLPDLEFSYDMSVPNVAHLEPQRGGCCTVMPFFIGDVLELPLTTAQDYTVFHVLGDYSTRLWQEQIDLVLEQNGLISFIAHPDYLREPRARNVYTDLLRLLVWLRAERDVWLAMPSEIDVWWRNRREMALVGDGASWRIVGPGSDRARIAFARLDGDRVVYDVAGQNMRHEHRCVSH
jgi:hypothetical protein